MTQRQVFSPLTLRAKGLAVGRGETVLAANLGFSITPGTGLLLRGPNGAGKSTLLLTLAGLLPALRGTIALDGHDPEEGPALHHCGHANAVRARFGVLDTLDFWAAINGRTGLLPEAALARVGLATAARLDAGYLSAGQQRRLALARLLVSRRPLWLLDEPTAALDTAGQSLLVAMLGDHLREGGIAIVATHDRIDLEGLATLTLDQAS